MPSATTREQILDAAEALFAEHGYAATSLRELTAAAGVNLAAVNYHFGGKEELAKAVLARRIAPINAERIRRLDASERPDVETIVRAFIEPALRAKSAVTGTMTGPDGPGESPGSRLGNLFGRILMEQPPFLREFLGAQFGGVVERFVTELARATRRKDSATVWWRLHFTVGAMAHTLHNAATLHHLSGGRCDPSDVEELVAELVAFATAGMAAPAPRRRRRAASTGRGSRSRGSQ